MSTKTFASQSEISDWLVELIAKEGRLAIQDVATETPFFELGLDSMMAVTLSGEIESQLGLELEPTALLDYPTISELSQHLYGHYEKLVGAEA